MICFGIPSDPNTLLKQVESEIGLMEHIGEMLVRSLKNISNKDMGLEDKCIMYTVTRLTAIQTEFSGADKYRSFAKEVLLPAIEQAIKAKKDTMEHGVPRSRN